MMRLNEDGSIGDIADGISTKEWEEVLHSVIYTTCRLRKIDTGSEVPLCS
jgi:hypothetical protein